MGQLLGSVSEPIPDKMMVLDPQIRDWVVLPMVLIMVFVGLGRHYVSMLLESDQTMDSSAADSMKHRCARPPSCYALLSNSSHRIPCHAYTLQANAHASEYAAPELRLHSYGEL